jgi:hypothetical protein
MLSGPILNTVVGAGIKLGANFINSWLAGKEETQRIMAARDQRMFDAAVQQQKDSAHDPFVKVTRRLLFMSLTMTYCFLLIYYALNPSISYDVIMPKSGADGGIFSFIFGPAKEFHVVKLTGGLLLMSFIDLMFMVVGFYAIPSKKR